MKKNTVLWCDSAGKQRRFIAINTSDAAVEDVFQTAAVLHKTGVAQWAIYFGDKGTPIKQWGISPEQAKVIAGMYEPVNQANNPGTAIPAQSSRPIKTVAVAEGGKVLQIAKVRKLG